MNVYIKLKRDIPLLYKNPWVFPNSIDRIEGNPKKGDIVTVFDSKKDFVGYGFYNPESFFKVRILSWNINKKIDEKFFFESIERCFRIRISLYKENYHTGFRLINSEGDGLPGFTCDIYNDVFIIKLTSYGYYNFLDVIVRALRSGFKKFLLKDIKAIINIINNNEIKEESLPATNPLIYGENIEDIYFYQDGIKFILNINNIQKTGFYFDQRFNRLFLKNFFSNYSIKNILDAYCYVGSFSCYLYENDRIIDLVDSSSKALEQAKVNCKINNVVYNIIKDDVENYLKNSDKIYDLIILDPPKLSVKEKDKNNAIKKYIYLNYLALNRIKKDGFLATFSCSGNLSFSEFSYSVLEALKRANRSHKVIYSSINSPDHPYSLAIEKTGYLKFLFIQVF
ncbi:MAG TPA: class I SAM-dependent methyltransferase [Spirochaetota bacterium]|nr:class I SAM-dependent methyltransferase [Spirochaetota bacterium]HOM37679.1 class I SAM-dependent methyltransferase [Spirochaetota bacterium]HPQ49637.1 class I SAM-dependent methyltransferase [Spirochaetota bacterium]